tara:strand:+ start:22694 stop:23080 length:387 start_codon:yes stop_codon:yes gene_type:complete
VKLISRQTQVAISIKDMDGLVQELPKHFQLDISFSVQPIGEITPNPAIDLIMGMGSYSSFLEIGQFTKKKRFDFGIQLAPKKIIDDHIILTGDVVHPGQPILQTVVGIQCFKNVFEYLKPKIKFPFQL